MAKNAYFVYILKCKDKTLYTGITNDLKKRLKVHNLGQGAKYTRGRRPVKFVYTERVKSLSKALSREHAIKQLTRQQKQKLIKMGN